MATTTALVRGVVTPRRPVIWAAPGEDLGVRGDRVPTAQGKQGKWQTKFPVRENAGNLEILPKHRENTVNSLILKV